LKILNFLAALAAASAACAAGAREEPLWELGLGAAGVHFPDYRGSSHTRNYALPAPYLVYRGEFLKADREGLRARLMRTEDLDLTLSAGASLPVRSEDNPVRSGMPDLKPSLELGTSLNWTLWRTAGSKLKLDARFPVRLAATVESRSRFIGGQFFPHLNLDVREPFGFSGWNLGLVAGPVYTDGRYNRYFYEVAPRYATAARPTYTTGGGYGGMQFLAALSRRFPKFWVGGFARYDTLNNAVFEESPLVTSKRYVAGGIAVAWILGESKERVEVTPFGDERR
jgi:outer membrane scaffolding protein for murein synthesis (MipA/OmpV family)